MSSSDSNSKDIPGPNKSLNNFSGGKEKSAFSPYKPLILTNLQRGNTEATFLKDVKLSFHERAGQGELSQEEVNRQLDIDILDQNELTPLHWACSYGQTNSVILLVGKGANVNKLAPDMISPLLFAAAGGHHEIVRILLKHGADVNHMDIMGNTALIFAAAGNHPHTCNELLGANPNIMQSNEDDETAYSLAIKNNANLSQSILEKYLEALLILP